MKALIDWLDDRAGVRKLVHESLYENIPSGARIRYICGSMLVFAFVTQAVTGVFLWMAYSPSSQTAWESVYYIEHQMTAGWLVRGIHHFMAQAMVVLLPFHLLQVVVDGAYRKPRELNFWLGLILMQIVLGLGLTGYLLPWDQKGYWATNVATNLMTLVPVVGADLQQLVIGGKEYGHHTLTRFFAMHAGVLPATLVAFLALHIAAFRRHGITAKITPGRKDQYFWPYQVLYDAVGCLVLLLIVTVLAWKVGAELGAPADPAQSYSAARPEWYYLFLFQLLKYFTGSSEVIGALVIPGVVMGLLFLMPIVGRSKWGHALNVVFVGLLLSGAGVLTLMALRDDNYEAYARLTGLDEAAIKKLPAEERERVTKLLQSSVEFREAKEQAEREAERAVALVERREFVGGELSSPRLIPKQGAVYLLRNDPLTQGPQLFARHCASCHDYASDSGSEAVDSEAGKDASRFVMLQSPRVNKVRVNKVRGEAESSGDEVERTEDGKVVYDDPPLGAPNLYRFGSREWVRGILNKDLISKVEFEAVPGDARMADLPDHPENHRRRIVSPYFGNTAHRNGRMATWVKQHVESIDKEDLEAIVAAVSAQARLGAQKDQDQRDAELIARGVGLVEKSCAKGCHQLGRLGQEGLAPDLTGYASYEWMMALISNSEHERFYGRENDRMPAFSEAIEDPASHKLSIREKSLIVDWIRGDYYRPRDEQPVLPHTEEEARNAVMLGRRFVSASQKVVGAAPVVELGKHRAERLFRENCSACHNYLDANGRGIVASTTSAANLYGFGSREWLVGLLTFKRIESDEYFGATAHFESDMVDYVRDNLRELDEAKLASLRDLIAALSSEAQLPGQAEADKQSRESGVIDKGRTALAETFSCTDCHKFHDQGDLGSAPDLTGWGSRDWLVEIISNPGHSRFYDERNDRMPGFAMGNPQKRDMLTAEEIGLIVAWLRGEEIR